MKILDKIARYEDSLAGILVLWPELVMTVPFDPGIFSKWQPVVLEIIRQLNTGLRPDLVTITEAFPDNDGLLFDLGCLAKDCPSSANYAAYLNGLGEMVGEVKAYREMQRAMRDIADGQPVKKTIGGMLNAVIAIVGNNTAPKFDYDAKEIAALLADSLEARYENRGKDEGKLKTGIGKLDAVVGHFQPADLVVVGARPAVGKTAWAVSVLLNMAFAGKNVGFISTEMSVEQVAYRMGSQLSGLPAKKFRECEFLADEWVLVADASAKLGGLGIRIIDKPEMTISEVVMRCRAWDMFSKLDVVIVDYLTRIKPDKDFGNKNLEVGDIAAQMKNIARALKIPVIVLAQLNRGSEKRADKTPTMADLRDSGIIEQEADHILLLHREKEAVTEETGGSFWQKGSYAPEGSYAHATRPEKNLIIVEKNRHGESGMSLEVCFDKQLMRWS